MSHIVVIGGGIVGLAVARELLLRRGCRVTVLEKEPRWARHQTGHNSGVVHAGLYYAAGSLKARLCRAGNRSIIDYARSRGVAARRTGKLVVAVDESELPRLHALAARAAANGVTARLISAAQAREHEPEVDCVAALHVVDTGVVDYVALSGALVRDLAEHGADLRLDSAVLGIRHRHGRVEIATGHGVDVFDGLVNCAGLHSDVVARMAGIVPTARIVPFRGEFHALRPERRHLVRGLIYPVPDPTLPFLGVHLTRGVDGEVHAGPNAVLALAREGYRWRDVSVRDLAEVAAFGGAWRLARRHLRTGVAEVRRSWSRERFARDLARLVPAIRAEDLVPHPAGVRAQAVLPDGRLVDDFLVQTGKRQVHVLNAPSPAATSALEIARHLGDRVVAAVGL
ncbi:L-2-hydroxyglutarate oxidase [Actinoalloteichus hoggarensis]|uniref:L-2-hydroxyglutarate oxidase LhgO n=1 Tax=Actinoalloteichus hoggarensis TaxID=1470176 RepID=A0A221VWA8_9PSEU|nr:L-2-hydroxyglutarate oxidase [Actinoalloteichus hoggarensis]ASO17805.1 L-2-hydroxyglutarate oxidase LhgO [Actinoalloteichus hoggarensis]MBB5922932.1 L-2-hydroxyglutarate oxidase [Actinoalloteichus hoggarensis]